MAHAERAREMLEAIAVEVERHEDAVASVAALTDAGAYEDDSPDNPRYVEAARARDAHKRMIDRWTPLAQVHATLALVEVIREALAPEVDADAEPAASADSAPVLDERPWEPVESTTGWMRGDLIRTTGGAIGKVVRVMRGSIDGGVLIVRWDGEEAEEAFVVDDVNRTMLDRLPKAAIA